MSFLKRNDLLFPEISYKIIGCAFEVHNKLGYGHSEKVYQKALEIAFKDRRLKFIKEYYCPLKFKNEIISRKYFDFLVEDKIVVEIKNNNKFSARNIRQVLEYIKTSELHLGILINFGPDQVYSKRIVNLPGFHK